MGFFLDLWWWLASAQFGFYGGGGVLWGVVATTLERERERERERNFLMCHILKFLKELMLVLLDRVK